MALAALASFAGLALAHEGIPWHSPPVISPGGHTATTLQPQFIPNQLTPPGLQEIAGTKFSNLAEAGANDQVRLPTATAGSDITPDRSDADKTGFVKGIGVAAARNNWLNDRGLSRQLAPPKVDSIWMPDTCNCVDPEFCPHPPPPIPPFSFEADALLLRRTKPDVDRLMSTLNATIEDHEAVDLGPAPRIRIALLGLDGYDIEGIYYGTDAWDEIVQFTTSGSPYALVFDSELQSGEVNLRWKTGEWWTWITGVRHFEFREAAQFDTDVLGLTTAWRFESTNYITGLQGGSEILLWNWRDIVSVDAVWKVGVFGNNADTQQRIVVGGFNNLNTINRFDNVVTAGEAGLNFKVRVCRECAITGGYQYLCLDNVAQAIDGFYDARGTGSVAFHGGMMGVEIGW